MATADTDLICRDCAQSFIFTSDERTLFASQGHVHVPSRCGPCRAQRKTRQEMDGAVRRMPSFRERGEQPSTTTTCAACGATTVVPFALPRNRTAYCSPCYEQRRTGTAEASRR